MEARQAGEFRANIEQKHYSETQLSNNSLRRQQSTSPNNLPPKINKQLALPQEERKVFLKQKTMLEERRHRLNQLQQCTRFSKSPIKHKACKSYSGDCFPNIDDTEELNLDIGIRDYSIVNIVNKSSIFKSPFLNAKPAFKTLQKMQGDILENIHLEKAELGEEEAIIKEAPRKINIKGGKFNPRFDEKPLSTPKRSTHSDIHINLQSITKNYNLKNHASNSIKYIIFCYESK